MNKLLIFTLLLLTSSSLLSAESKKWNETIKKVTDSVVSIQVNVVRSFDTENSYSTQATGFVVDAKRGIILTNRHVVNPGPITAEAIFSNNEEIELRPIYRDPVHDFGFFQYNPKDLKFIQPKSLKLTTTSAKVGDEIKLIGNDSGEHMSILSGTLARLDRAAPAYRRGSYNDFNTFYFQSSADSSGGSSGSPVINIKGEVVALNAGGNNQSSSSFFLPLYKVTQALKAIQNNQPIKRGSILSTLEYTTYDQARRLGLSAQMEKNFRQKKNGNGVLVVKSIVLNSNAHQKLRPGDIILSAQSNKQNHQYLNRHEDFATFLDQHVNQEIELTISRQGKILNKKIKVQDLHQVTPDEYIQLAGGIFHNFSYQLARQTNLPIDGVYVASPGYMFSQSGVNRRVVIQSINEHQINHLNDFYDALSQLQQNEYFAVKYVHIGTPNKQRLANVKFQTNWHLSQRCKRKTQQSNWACHHLQWNRTIKKEKPVKVKLAKHSDSQTTKFSNSLVMVNSSLPYYIDGQNFQSYSGTGLVIDANEGLVVVDRNTVPIKMLDVKITVAGIADIPAEVLFVHPIHSFTLLKYDPLLLPGSPLKSAKLSNKALSAGDSIWLVGYQANNRLISEKVNISLVEPLSLPIPSIPQFKDSNTNSIVINNPPNIASGILIDKKANIRAWWTNFSIDRSGEQILDRGLPIDHIIDIREQYKKNKEVSVNSLEIEVTPISIAQARNLGLSDSWIEQLQDSTKQPQAFIVTSRVKGSDAFNHIENGDLILAINQQTVREFKDLEKLGQQVEVSVWRGKKQYDLNIKTQKLSQLDTQEIYLWSGALVQKPHRAIAAQTDIESNGVYVSWYWYGSPANRYNLSPLQKIIELEGEEVSNLQQFISLTQKYRHKTYLSIRAINLIGRETIITLKQDHQYWPTQRVFWDGNGWKNELVE